MANERYYRLPPDVDVVEVKPGRYVLRSDSARTRIEGASAEFLVAEVFPRLDGRRSLTEIVAAVKGVGADDLSRHLDGLVASGVLEVSSAPREASPPWKAMLRRIGFPADDQATSLDRASVAIVGLEAHGSLVAANLAAAGVGRLVLIDPFPCSDHDVDVAPFLRRASVGSRRADAVATGLKDAGFGATRITAVDGERLDRESLAESIGECDLLVSCFDKGFSSTHHWVNRVSIGQRIPAIYAQSGGHGAMLGPLVVPGQTACFMCYRMRSVACEDDVEAAMAYEHFLDGCKQPRLALRPALPMVFPYIASLVSLEVVKLLLGLAPPALAGHVLEFDGFSLQSELHPVLRAPECPVCREDKTGMAQPARRRSTAGASNLPAAAPVLVSAKTGVVRELTTVQKDPSEPPLPFVVRARLANHRFAAGHEDLFACSGKGMTIEDARLSALGEAVERYSAGIWQPQGVTWSARGELDGESLDPRELVLYADEQYADLPYARYDGSNVLGWAKARSLLDEREVYVPALALYMAYETRTEDEYLCPITSNGLAAGSSPADATLRAVLEVLERDAFMITWLARLETERVDASSHPHADVVALAAAYRRRGVEVRLHRLPTDHPVHIFAAFLRQGSGDGPAVVAGLGADLDPALAARRAVLEAAQVRPALRRRARSPEMKKRLASLLEDPRRVTTLDDHDLLYTSRERLGAFDFLFDLDTMPLDWAAPALTADEQLGTLVNHFRARGQEILHADLTSPDVGALGLYTSRAILPGFQPIDFGWRERRLGGRRLFQLPQTLGRAASALSLADLNPDPHPIS